MSTGDSPEGTDDLDGLVLDEAFIRGGVAEPSAEERIAAARRIARANDRLQAQGEIADGSGKPAFRTDGRGLTILAIATCVAAVVVIVALIAR